MKICIKCKQKLEDICFSKRKSSKSGLSYNCKKCEKENRKEYRKNNRERILKIKREYYNEHREEIIKESKEYNKKHKKEIELNRNKWTENNPNYNKEYYKNNREILLNNVKEYRKNNKEKIRNTKREYRKSHKEKVNELNRRYYKKYKIRLRERKRNYNRNKLRNDTNYKLISNIRTRVWIAIKNNQKSVHTIELIGCSIQNLKYWLQWTAIKNGYLNFNINNYKGKEFHIDHIVPCYMFNMSDPNQQRECFNWRNMQILKAEENLIKNNKVDK
jgi:hypothetical protein